MKRCPKCTSLMPDDVTRCIKCGFDSAQKSAGSPVVRPQPAARPVAPVARQAGAPKPAPTGAGAQAKPGKFRGGWALAVQSWRVLMLDKELLVFPLLSGISCFLVLASFAAGILVSGIGQRETGPSETLTWIVVFAYYFANYFVIVFFNSALVACAMIRFRGGDPTVADGLRAASARIAQIMAWALLAATVGVILRMIEERVALVGRIVIALLGAVWTIAAYFVVPVLVVEKVGPIEAFKRSAMIIKNTWGESLVSNVGIGLATFLAAAALIIATAVFTAMLWMMTGSAAILVAGGAAIVVLLVLWALVSSALSSIVLSALYLYASEQKVPDAFGGIGLEGAFAPK